MEYCDTSSPAAAKPTAVEPNALICIRAFAAASSSSVAISGSSVACAGSQNWPTALDSTTITYSQPIPKGNTNGISAASSARSRSALSMIRLRSHWSTNTPAIKPTSRLGSAVAISITPTLSAEPVRRKIRIDAASEVSALPIVETSCASHSSANERLRNTANGDGCNGWRDVVMPPL